MPSNASITTDPRPNKVIAKIVRKRRRELHLSMREMASGAQVSLTWLQRIEAGREVSLSSFIRFAQRYGLQVPAPGTK